MIVQRTIEFVVKKFKIDDRISVGKYTATAVERIDDNTMLFCLDQYLDEPFTHDDLLDKLNEYLQADLNFKIIMHKVAEINGIKFRVPYVGEMFGKDDFYESDKYDGTWYDQWLSMKDRRNHIADREGVKYEWGWLMNRVKEYATNFASVASHGGAHTDDASASFGVRPVFALEEGTAIDSIREFV